MLSFECIKNEKSVYFLLTSACRLIFLEVEMSKLFCVSPGLRVLERQMQQPPGYRPRGYVIHIVELHVVELDN